ncbi:hypothetical protein CCP3SC5AM1_710013 [Gammaproteobacteria bacterium]
MNAHDWVFWILIGLMTVMAVLISALPWIRPRTRETIDRKSLNVAVYRDRMNELDTALDYPSLSFEQREDERYRLAQELLEDVNDSVISSPTYNNKRWTLFAISTVFPLIALLLYSFLGTGTRLFSQMETRETASRQQMPSTKQIEQMVSRLAERLVANPEDANGWMMLARSYTVLERYPEAAKAYAQAYALEGDNNPQLGIDYAEALVLANGNRITDEARTVLAKVFEKTPDHPHGLWLAGLWAFQEKHYQVAVEFWQRLKSLLPQGSNVFDKIETAIAEARNEASRR